MRLYVIGHEDAVLGFSLAGVEGLATRDPQEAIERLEELAADGETGIIIVTSDLAEKLGSEIDALRNRSDVPLVLEIPAPGYPLRRPPLRELIRRAIGIGL